MYRVLHNTKKTKASKKKVTIAVNVLINILRRVEQEKQKHLRKRTLFYVLFSTVIPEVETVRNKKIKCLEVGNENNILYTI